MARKIAGPTKRPAMPARVASRTREPSDPDEVEGAQSSTEKESFPIVGVGASAGGLEAFTAFLTHLPSDPGMAFVLIQHLDPNQPSQLTNLLSKATNMTVLEVSADTPVEMNRVYVMAPAVCLSISDGCLRAEPRGPGGRLPIDWFLRSLAEDKSSNAVGIVLSGTASDGTLGLKAVKSGRRDHVCTGPFICKIRWYAS
jgi:two-component system CheB/CheR fusion protein